MIGVFLSDGSYNEYEMAESVRQEDDQFFCLDRQGRVQASYPVETVLMYSFKPSIRPIAAKLKSMYESLFPGLVGPKPKRT